MNRSAKNLFSWINFIIVLYFTIQIDAVSIRKKKNQSLNQIDNLLGAQDHQIKLDTLSPEKGEAPTNKEPPPISKPSLKQMREKDTNTTLTSPVTNLEDRVQQDPKRVRKNKNWRNWYESKKEARLNGTEKQKEQAEKYFKEYNDQRRKRYGERVKRIKEGKHSENDLKIYQKTMNRIKNWKSNNKDKSIASFNKWKSNNKDKIYEKQKSYRLNNFDKIQQYNKEWKSNNRERVKQINRTSQKKYREKMNLAQKSPEES